MTPLAVLHGNPAANVAAVDADLRQARDAWAYARRACKARDDRLNRANLEGCRGRIDRLLDRRLELTR